MEAIVYDLRGEDRERFEGYERARSLQDALRTRYEQGSDIGELASLFDLDADDIRVTLKAFHSREHTRP
jgi:hypothetical protein